MIYQGGLQELLQYIKEQDPDKVSVGLASSLDTVAEIELLQVSGSRLLCWIDFIYSNCIESLVSFQKSRADMLLKIAL